MSFLKHVILPSLERTNQIEKFHTVQTITADELSDRLSRMNVTNKTSRKAKRRKEATIVAKPEGHSVHSWLWRIKEVQALQPPVEPEVPPLVEAIGMNNDISHLNKRRQQSRQESLPRDLKWAAKLEEARLRAAGRASEDIARFNANQRNNLEQAHSRHP